MSNKQFLPITKHDAAVVVLELIIKGTARLFDERCNDDPRLTPDNLQLLREARDRQIERLRENLAYAKKAAR